MKKSLLRGLGLAAALALLIAPATANADTTLKLGNRSTGQKVGTGAVTVTLTDHRARLSPSMVSLPTSRTAWMSGTLTVKVTGQNDYGTILAGYLTGCQIDVGSASATGTITGDSGITVPGSVGPTVGASTDGSISLAAGQIGVRLLTHDKAVFPKAGDELDLDWQLPKNYYEFTGNTGSLAFSDRQIGVDGCGGYAQARFFAQVTTLVGNAEATTTLWSQPFTLG